MKGILGKKLGMTQVFNAEGQVIPVTVIDVSSCHVLQKKDVENDGYNAIQLGYEDMKNPNKPAQGHAKKAGVAPKRYIREIRDVNLDEYEVGQQLKADLFSEGEYVDVTGTSKGKGFAGTIKRWGQARGPMSHGSGYHRGHGSLAIIRTANRVPKGKHLPGRMGNETVTIQNLQVVRVDAERNVIMIKGSVPGPNKGYVTIKSSVKHK